MIAAWLCGAFFGGLVVWKRWAHVERERRWQQVLDTLPPSDDDDLADWFEEDRRYWHDDWDNGIFPEYSGRIAIEPNSPGITVEGIPLDVWMQQFEPTSAIGYGK